MAATFQFGRDSGDAAGSPAKGTVRTATVTDVNWKAVTTEGTLYSASPITDGANSVENWLYGHFSGTFNQISAGLFAHTNEGADFGAGITLKGPTSMTVDGDNETYTTPSATTNANLSVNMTSEIAITSGSAVWFGATGPEAASKAASMTTNPCYTNWLVTQLQTSGASAGDTSTVTLTLRYNEN